MNFKQHTTIGAVVGYLASAILLLLNLISPITSIWIILASIVGSFLPDIDSDCSKSFNIFISMLSLISGFGIIMYCGNNHMEHIWYWIWTPFAFYLLFRYVFSKVIKKMTKHRAIIHSTPAIFTFGVGAFYLLRTFDVSLMSAFWMSFSLGLGFMSHIFADEFHSRIQFEDGHLKYQMKSSAGSAWDLGDLKEWSTYAMYMLLFTLACLTLMEYIEIFKALWILISVSY